ncbi:MAG: RagB/SusD family nutrient uptake outer membrane protein [Prevotella sp.]|nr:RagB/SusD family nutrient uptake outer membrane protein [Prevotella sp.]
MIHIINSKIRSFFRFTIYSLLPLVGGGWVGVSCSDILDTESELVEYEKDNTLDHPTDSVYSVMGIINRMQVIADRTVLLGEVRSDLLQTTDEASADLKRLAAFDFSQQNKYNKVSDYYAVINNCNYYLAHVDTLLERRNRKLFRSEYAAVKGFRAWTYLELVKAYGEVPLVTEPLMTELAAKEAQRKHPSTIKEVCDFFINDLTPYANTDMPVYGSVGGWESQRTAAGGEYNPLFIPLRVLLGDLCLWAGRYEEAARWYNSFLNDQIKPVTLNKTNRIYWYNASEFISPTSGYHPVSIETTGRNSGEVISLIPMEKEVFNGTISDLNNVFNSTKDNNYFFQVMPSVAMRRLSADQIHCIEYKTAVTTDTIYVPRTGMSDELLVGDLRLYDNYRLTSLGSQDPYSEYSSLRQSISKLPENCISLYRKSMIYLRYAEALNRAGYPQTAFTILKYGICPENMQLYVDSIERASAAAVTEFDKNIFLRDIAIGIHSYGSGDSQCNAYYVLPQPDSQLATRRDTVDFQIPLVEDMIISEMALEGAFEGNRYYDLLRVAMRRNDPAYLADAVAKRYGEVDNSLRTLLMDKKNWFIPLP